ncbi:hypothetical protein AZO1586I_1761 [Bathymodiolus thermophilus thioautotrophic gill symbiont]|uniref:Uncharacterized protein n=1 Tax=Bathymodiolus thermophilus thioautotrophic gill symbiont TaxID=2360 RepID=A0ABM8M9N7_9GAMM|nr:hypothetical protein AZO1586I_1761 [Bathymodiolus thermophilus thioautotrophic gill symbiont]CAC5815588.1 hypothetical protein [uncultured Gammaproteobacteria bacterium]CAC9504396.1 hypothetical protein [uncultured Gammaproteobacteria bacterium]VVH55845.1 hypothetical protein BAZOLSSOX_1043 [uncultured Gammaproteobacteria bacterium]
MLFFIKKYYLGLLFIIFSIDIIFFNWKLYGFFIPTFVRYISGGALFLLGIYIIKYEFDS